MHKKIIMACMAIAAFAALVAAPAASATNLTENKGTLKPGAWVTGTNVGNTLFEAGELTTACTKANINAKIIKDEGGTILGEVAVGGATETGTGTSGDCTSNLGSVKPSINSKLCLHVNNSDTGTITGCGANVTFTLNVTGIVTCTYQTASISGTITTEATGDAHITLGKAPATRDTGNTFFCPATGTITQTFLLETTDGTTLTFST